MPKPLKYQARTKPPHSPSKFEFLGQLASALSQTPEQSNFQPFDFCSSLTNIVGVAGFWDSAKGCFRDSYPIYICDQLAKGQVLSNSFFNPLCLLFHRAMNSKVHAKLSLRSLLAPRTPGY